MSGHITSMSRGSRVGSSASSPSSTSRSTSTWRATPWHACTCTERSPGSRVRPGRVGRVGARRRPGASRAGCPGRAATAPSVSARGLGDRERALELARVASEARQQRVAHGLVAVVGARHGARGARRARAQRAGDGCGSQTCTSRCVAQRREQLDLGHRQPGVAEQREPRRQVERLGVLAQRLDACAGGARPAAAPPRRSTSRRHSSGCQARSRSSGTTGAVGVAALAPVGDELRPLPGVRREQAGQPPGDREAPAEPEVGLLPGRPVAEVRGQGRRPRLVEAGVEHLEQRPGQRVGRPRVVVAARR